MVDRYMTIGNDLRLFGLSEQEQQVYLLIASRGWSTVVQLAKHCPIKRSTLYRILESLIKKGLVATQVGEKTSFYNVASTDAFENIVFDSEKKTNQMREAIEKIKKFTTELSNIKLTETTLLYYKGLRGLKQMEWKIRSGIPNSEVQVFDSLKWANVVGADFAEKMRGVCVEKNIRYRSISNSEDPIEPNGTTSWTANKKYTTKYYRHKLISRKILDIRQDIFITPNSIVFWGVKTGDEVAVQITNIEYAAMMRQIFEFMWDKAKAIDNFGERFK